MKILLQKRKVGENDEEIIASGAGTAAGMILAMLAKAPAAGVSMEAERIAEDPSGTMREMKLKPEQRYKASF